MFKFYTVLIGRVQNVSVYIKMVTAPPFLTSALEGRAP
jgi:hypothetical protein